MTQPVATCPNCGAKVVFRWSSSVQTVCDFCKSILVRTDVDLKKVGDVADLPPDSSPIQIGSEGSYNHRPFVAVGRIVYQYDQGTWNEWHVVMNDGNSGWLSDAQDEYAISFAAPGRKIPAEPLRAGQQCTWDNVLYTVSVVTYAHYRGVQGEMPFQTWDKDNAVFVDLRSSTGKFATVDYSDATPILYLGESVAFDDLHLKNLRTFEGWS
ncbi:MAG TPA: DUF4178 domain-containing protein [Terriglobales bacterium]|nr:DUF4178 domain-containing protein [Terriglobales bacterium]